MKLFMLISLLFCAEICAQGTTTGTKGKYPPPEPLSKSPLLSSNKITNLPGIPAIDYAAPYIPSVGNDDRVILFNEIRAKAGKGDADSLYRLASYYYPTAKYPVVSLEQRSLSKEQKASPEFPAARARDNLSRWSLAFKYYSNAADKKHYKSMITLMLMCEKESTVHPSREAVIAAQKWRNVITILWKEPKQMSPLEISSASLQAAREQADEWVKAREAVPTPVLTKLDTSSIR
jgi:hypothetical protein